MDRQQIKDSLFFTLLICEIYGFVMSYPMIILCVIVIAMGAAGAWLKRDPRLVFVGLGPLLIELPRQLLNALQVPNNPEPLIQVATSPVWTYSFLSMAVVLLLISRFVSSNDNLNRSS